MVSVLLLFRGSLVWSWVLGPSCLSVIFAGGCHFYASALFLTSASFHRCRASILSMIPLAYLLFVLAFPAFSFYISLWHLCPLPWSSSPVLSFCCRVLVRVFRSLRAASSVTTPGPPLASAVSGFLFPSFVTRSNLSILIFSLFHFLYF